MSLTRYRCGSGHAYKLDGSNVTGVTTLIRNGMPAPGLMYWSARTVAEFVADADEATLDALRTLGRHGMVDALKGVPWKKRDEAAVRGTDVHKLAERLSKGEQVDVPEHLAGHVESCVAFLDEWQPVPVLTEAVVGARGAPPYAGTLDLVADLPDGTRALFDYKTSASGIYPKDVVQLAAYRFAEFFIGTDGTEVPMSEVGIQAAYAVRVLASGYEVIPLETGTDRETSPAFGMFRAAAYIARRVDVMKEWVGDAAPRPLAVAA